MAKNKKKSSKKEVVEEYYILNKRTKKALIVILLMALFFISFLSFFDLAGLAGTYIDKGLSMLFGWSKYLFLLVLLFLAIFVGKGRKSDISWVNYLGLGLFVLGVTSLFHLKASLEYSFTYAWNGDGGGLIGFILSYPLQIGLGFWASLTILIAIAIASVLLMVNNIFDLIHKLFNPEKLNFLNFFRKVEDEYDEDYEEDDEEEYDEEEVDEDEEDESVNLKARKIGELKTEEVKSGKVGSRDGLGIKPSKIKINLPVSLLNGTKSKPTSGDIKVNMEKIEATLSNFGIPIEMGGVKVGPTVTQFTFKPADGIKLSKITSLGNDLALSLAAHPIRIEAPIPGKSLVGVEVPNQQSAIVRLRELLDSKDFKKRKSNMSVALGKDVSGKCWYSRLEKMPHLLIAGATGSGKSVCIHGLIVSLLYQNNPETLRLILVDPKRVELPAYNGIPHLLTPVITDVPKTINALRWSIMEMDNRFDVLSKAGKRDIASYNAVAKEKMPYIVIVIDELADLMVTAANEVEGCIIRLTQMARAVGIHLVLATQRPSVDVITGLIKANVPARIAFSVASLMDSRTILDTAGAEKLIGKGDMLYLGNGEPTPRRLQGTFVTDEEVKKITNYLKQAAGEVEYDNSIVESSAGSNSFSGGSGKGEAGDELYPDAKKIIIESGKASASFLQRRMRVGYARAARLIDLLEDEGIIGPANGSKPREVLIDNLDDLDNSTNNDNIVEDEPVEFEETLKSDNLEEVELNKELVDDDFEDDDEFDEDL